MKINSKKIIYSAILTCLFFNPLSATNSKHFYNAPKLYSRTDICRFDNKEHYNIQDWHTRLDLKYSYGNTRSAWKHSGGTTTLLNSTGNQNMLYLMENVKKTPDMQDFANFLSYAQINQTKTNNSFGQLEFNGKFEVQDFDINLRQNIIPGFFIEVLAPIKKVDIKNITYTDKSPTTGLFSQNTWEWKQLKNNLNSILANYNIKEYDKPFSKSGIGDLSLLLGWQGYPATNNDIDIQTSLKLKCGVLFPTGSKTDPTYIFSVPTGQDNHWGISLFAELSVNYKQWLTLNAHAGNTFFFDSTKTKNMKTFDKQNGSIKLSRGSAKEEKGLLWHIGIDARADHFIKGLSALLGYSFTRQEEDFLWPQNTTTFNVSTVNSDTALAPTSVNVLHLMVDYDFSVHMINSKWAPRMNFFYDYPFSGKNIFKTDMIGGGLGLDVRWNF